MESLVSLLTWYLALQAILWVSAPLAFQIFGRLPLRGFYFWKPLGLVLVGTPFWLFCASGLVRPGVAGAWFTLVLVLLVSILAPLIGRSSPRDLLTSFFAWVGRNGARIAAAELIFVVCWLLVAWIRFHDPAANHTEQPMDLMMLTSCFVSLEFPPQDAWFAGHPINYYYYGYWLVMMLGKIAGVTPELSYNLALSSWFGLLAQSVFGLGLALSGSRRNERVLARFVSGRKATAVLCLVAVCLTANLAGLISWGSAGGSLNLFGEEILSADRGWSGGYDWWWWQASRWLVDAGPNGEPIEIISEFPSFSYILGDLHPHLLGMPFLVLAIALALVLFLSRRSSVSRSNSVRSHSDCKLALTAASLTLGSLLITNAWDFPGFSFLILLALFAGSGLPSRQPHLRQLGLALAALVGGVILVSWPFVTQVRSPLGGLAPNFFNPSGLSEIGALFGPQILGVICLVAMAWREYAPRFRNLTVWLISILLLSLLPFVVAGLWILLTDRAHTPFPGFGPQSISQSLSTGLERWLAAPFTWLLLVGLLSVILALLWERRSPAEPGEKKLHFILLLSCTGILLLLVPELIFARDAFETRMNTVFKLHYQAWLLLSLTAILSAVRALRSRSRILRLSAVLTLLLILAPLIYPAAAVYSKTRGFAEGRSLDALESYCREEREAVRWIRQNVPESAILLEAAGESYRVSMNRMSRATGRATLLGWKGHEMQWRRRQQRESVQDREAVVATLFETESPSELTRLLKKWNISFLLVGPVELSRYQISREKLAILSTMMRPVYSSESFQIFQRRE